MSAIAKGLKRRGRLMAQAVSPPRKTLDAIPTQRPAGHRQQPSDGYTAPLAPRLVDSPAFVLSSVRSGSTLLRVLLNSHSRIRAPHEMHLRTVHVRMSREFTADAMKELALDREELEHVLWDRVLHLELSRSGKDVIVDKTPPNTLIWPRLHRCWPDARFILLLRHPGAVVQSLTSRRADPDHEAIRAEVLGYAEKLEEARQHLPGAHVITYEDLTADPERVTRGLCGYLGVPWESGMLDYGQQDHGTFRPKLGDWSSEIRSGRIQAARQADPAAELPPRLAEIAKAWGYPV
ncbi:sulfotransferase family protein [Streptomyces fuscichromogenes]|uniref:Sulfotransferase family protein n=1 Tax=Streptomyces fuscichromogenes TaxID=1324013 RepID=A0A918CUC8_9ACTN|nr:sulfotransferase [Streptomyces fuscichromogenes]GGN27327.1 sulfotransferase family protein [Streptomyces fuscichromogenes]